MASRKEVIEGLFACAYKDCRSCPYWGMGSHDSSACKTLAADALALLKELEPCAMTLEEVRLPCEDDIVWYEHKGVQPHPRVVEFVFDERITFTDGGVWSFSADGYGERWRLWTSRPTDEQRGATPWGTGMATG